jgi:hypothetical protein
VVSKVETGVQRLHRFAAVTHPALASAQVHEGSGVLEHGQSRCKRPHRPLEVLDSFVAIGHLTSGSQGDADGPRSAKRLAASQVLVGQLGCSTPVADRPQGECGRGSPREHGGVRRSPQVLAVTGEEEVGERAMQVAFSGEEETAAVE